jgi:putative transcriptional regulator
MSRSIMAAGALIACAALAKQASAQSLSMGALLVATEKLGDPNFAESVVLLIQHDDEEGTVGVILNRRTKVPLTKLFPDIKGASADPIFMGGPVALTSAQALLKLAAGKDEARHISGDLYVTGSKEVIEASVRSHAKPSDFRLYVGYAGWAPGQLEAEIRMGAWSVLSPRPGLVFDPDPESLWDRLTRESHMQIADLGAKGPLRAATLRAQAIPLIVAIQPGSRQ